MIAERVVLITGSAKRIGASIAETFHENGWKVIIHHNDSVLEASCLADKLNAERPKSALSVRADLLASIGVTDLARRALGAFGRLDALINNASLAIKDDVLNQGGIEDWNRLFMCNTFAPHQLTYLFSDELTIRRGSVVNLLDVRATTLNPFHGWAIYTASKSALHALTLSAAKELAPDVRVNGISPGITLPFPGEEWDEAMTEEMQRRGVLNKTATPNDIADAVYWLTTAGHVTGQVITVDGGESLRW